MGETCRYWEWDWFFGVFCDSFPSDTKKMTWNFTQEQRNKLYVNVLYHISN